MTLCICVCVCTYTHTHTATVTGLHLQFSHILHHLRQHIWSPDRDSNLAPHECEARMQRQAPKKMNLNFPTCAVTQRQTDSTMKSNNPQFLWAVDYPYSGLLPTTNVWCGTWLKCFRTTEHAISCWGNIASVNMDQVWNDSLKKMEEKHVAVALCPP